jgi:aminopeptidase N
MSGFAAMNDDYGRDVLENERENVLAAHEFSHQWWGNMVTNLNWNQFWLDEGMATFMAAVKFGRQRQSRHGRNLNRSFNSPINNPQRKYRNRK